MNKIFKITLILFLSLFLFYSCSKEDTPDNIQEYKLTSNDLKLLPYEVGDTIRFKVTDAEDGYIEDTIRYAITNKKDSTYVDNQGNTFYIKYVTFENDNYFNGKLILIKTKTGFDFKIHYIDPNSEPSIVDKIENVKKNYVSLNIDSSDYTNVYKIEAEDSSYYSLHECFYIKRAFINADYGILRIEKYCKIMDLIK